MHFILLAVNHPIYQTRFSLSPEKRAHQSAKIHGRDKEHFGLMVNDLLFSISMGYLTRKEGRGRKDEKGN